jgi:hypothetical protein
MALLTAAIMADSVAVLDTKVQLIFVTAIGGDKIFKDCIGYADSGFCAL